MDAVIAMSTLMVNLRAQDLRATPLQLGLIGMAWGIPFALFSPFVGRIAHHIDRRYLMIAGPLIYGVSVTIYGFSQTPLLLIIVSPLGGLGCALFWPTFETLLHAKDPHEQKQQIEKFNLGWTFGLMSGAAFSGHLYSLLGRVAFAIPAGIVFFNAFYLTWRMRCGLSRMLKSPEEAETVVVKDRPSSSQRRGFLYMAWVTNFVLFFASAVVATIFPPLARTLGISDGTIGVLVALITVAQAGCFFLSAASLQWHYRFYPLLSVMGIGIIGLVLLGNSISVMAFAGGLACIGFARGLSYSASLFYGLDDTGSHGVNMGIHEGLVGITFVAGPLLSGFVADRGTLRSPFLLASMIILTGMVILLLIRKRTILT